MTVAPARWSLRADRRARRGCPTTTPGRPARPEVDRGGACRRPPAGRWRPTVSARAPPLAATAVARRGLVVMFTGLSGSGKSTLAAALADPRRRERTTRSISVLDGDEVRRLLSSDLGFDKGGRENERATDRLRREPGRPARRGRGLRADRPVRRDPAGRPYPGWSQVGAHFVLVHVATPLEVCEARDVKGLYARARPAGCRRSPASATPTRSRTTPTSPSTPRSSPRTRPCDLLLAHLRASRRLPGWRPQGPADAQPAEVIMPAATVRLVAWSISTNPPVARFREYSSDISGWVVRSRTRPTR